MLKNAIILSFSKNDWEEPWMNRHQIMSRLAINNKILFISPSFRLSDIKNRNYNNRKGGIKKINDNLFTFIPPIYLPHNYRCKIIEKVLMQFRIMMIKKIIKRWGNTQIILYIWHYDFYDFVGKFGESLVCYHIYDDFAKYYGFSRKETEIINCKENKLISNSDIIFTVTKGMIKRKNLGNNAYLIPNGADFQLFSKASLLHTTIPKDMITIPHPIIGYVGTIGSKVDFRLLLKISILRPKWSIVLIGKINKGIESNTDFIKLKNKKNVYILGSRRVKELPSYIKAIDVCLLCYDTTTHAFDGYPLKMHEYLSAGKPVISSNISVVHDFSYVIKISSSIEEWIKNIELALNERDKKYIINLRQNIAKENTWDKRVNLISKILAQHLNLKG